MTRRPPRSPLFPYTPLSRPPLRRPEQDGGLPAVEQEREEDERVGDRHLSAHAGYAYAVARADAEREDDEKDERKVDRKSTRLNSSHDQISYAVFCLKKKKSN